MGTLEGECMKKPFFHEISDADFEVMKAAGVTWGQLKHDYAQPDWCTAHDALDPLGCWSLIERLVTGYEFCKHCEYCRRTKEHSKANV